MLTLTDILYARRRIARYLTPTPLERAPVLPGEIWLKLENVNPMHSFKVRGALNAVLSLDANRREWGIVAASSGNHAGGLAYAASQAGIKAKILMPGHTPQRKISAVKAYGAEAVLFGETYDECEAQARRLERESGMVYISPYNDARVIAGAGTIGLEIAEQLPEVARVVVCVGGGGLLSGVATAVKALKPAAEIIGVCAEAAPAMYNRFYDTHKPEIWDTLAEALSGEVEEGSITVPITKALVSKIITVDEAQIAAAMRWMLDIQGWLVEGGGAVGVAAALYGLLPVDDRPTVIVVSGANVDGETFRRIYRI